MNPEEAWRPVEEYTRETSVFARKLGFAGIALAWILRSGEFQFSWLVLLGLGLLILYFALDVLHYVIATRKTRAWLYGVEEKGWKETGALPDAYPPRPRDLDKWPWRLWHAKLATLSLGHTALILEVLRRLVA